MGAAVSVVAVALQRLAADVGPDQAAQLWQDTGLDLLSFMPSVSDGCVCIHPSPHVKGVFLLVCFLY